MVKNPTVEFLGLNKNKLPINSARDNKKKRVRGRWRVNK